MPARGAETVTDPQRFSGPLTPTIRRYLNLPAGNGAPAKGKARAPAPARQPAANHAANSHPTKAEPPAKIQNHRVAALVTKPARAAYQPASHPAPLAPERHQPGPSRQPLSPEKPVEAPVPEPKTPHPRDHSRKADAPRHIDPHGVRAGPVHPAVAVALPPHRRPEALAAPSYGRSVSHNILPSFDQAYSKLEHAPAHRADRPALPQSYSTTSLPADTHSGQGDTQHPLPLRPSRFATGPVRIVRPVPMPANDEVSADEQAISVDGFFYTPSGATVLGGPGRPPPAIGHGRRPMGQAQRRVVTAPETGATGSVNMLGKTPAARRVMSRSVRERVEELDERAASVSPAKLNGVELSESASSPRRFLSSTSPVKHAESTRVYGYATAPVSPTSVSATIDSLPPSAGTTAAPKLPDVEGKSNVPPMGNSQLGSREPGPVAIAIAAQSPLPPDELPLNEASADDVARPSQSSSPARATSAETRAVEEPIEHLEGGSTRGQESGIGLEYARPNAAQSVPEVHMVESVFTQQLPVTLDSPSHATATADEDCAALNVPNAAAIAATTIMVTASEDPVDLRESKQMPVGVSGANGTGPAIPSAAPKVASVSVNVNDKPLIARATTSRTVSGRSVKTGPADFNPDNRLSSGRTETTTSSVPLRKPPVPRAAAVSRPTKPVERKPFRPVSAADTTAAARAVAAKDKAIAKVSAPARNKADAPSGKTEALHASAVVAKARAVSAQSKASSSASSSKPPAPPIADPVPIPRVVSKGSTLLAPTKASASRTVPASHPHPQTRPAIPAPATASTALPPVRKEKIKLKAALPSFRPVRQAVAVAAASATPATAQTIPITSSSTSAAIRRVGAKVKPESIPLPASPPKGPVTAPTQSITPPISGSSGRARVRPEQMPLPASPPSRTSPGTCGRASATAEQATVTKPEDLPLPLSPTATKSDSNELALASAPLLNDFGLPMPAPLPDRFTSASSSRSKSSSAPTESAPDSDTDEDDDLTGVTFKVRPDTSRASADTESVKQAPRPRVIQQTSKGDLMEFSSPANRGGGVRATPTKVLNVMGSTTPKYTPSRRALVFMDANVRSPLVSGLAHGSSGSE